MSTNLLGVQKCWFPGGEGGALESVPFTVWMSWQIKVFDGIPCIGCYPAGDERASMGS